jgi:hypothetical protein
MKSMKFMKMDKPESSMKFPHEDIHRVCVYILALAERPGKRHVMKLRGHFITVTIPSGINSPIIIQG